MTLTWHDTCGPKTDDNLIILFSYNLKNLVIRKTKLTRIFIPVFHYLNPVNVNSPYFFQNILAEQCRDVNGTISEGWGVWMNPGLPRLPAWRSYQGHGEYWLLIQHSATHIRFWTFVPVLISKNWNIKNLANLNKSEVTGFFISQSQILM